MRAPFDVALTGSTTGAHISQRVSDVTLAATSPGGFASVTLTLDEPILSQYLDQFDTVTVYDARTAEVVGAGRLTDPGRTTGASGEVWQITAIGEGPAHMLDQTLPLVYIENILDGFYPLARTGAAAQAAAGATPSATTQNALVLSASGGSILSNGTVIAMTYDRLADSSMELGGYAFTREAGVASANDQLETTVYGRDGTPANATITTANFAASATVVAAKVAVTDFTAGADILVMRWQHTGGAVTVADDVTWGAFYNLYVAARRWLKDGTRTPSADHANTYVLASEVFADILGRGLLPRFDGANATIATTTHHIDQLAWLDGVSPSQVMTELFGPESLEPGFTWHVWEKQTNGLFRTELVAWPSTVRYEATVADGFSSPAPASDVYNVVNVRGRDARGRVRWTTCTQSVASLTALGITRAYMIDMGDETYSTANATRVGNRFLADHATPPNAGTLTIARPVMDLVSGRMVQPWMVRPGNLVRVRGVRPSVDSLNATDRDGVTVFRIVSSVFSDSSASATLELDTYSRTESREIARLATHRGRKN